MWRTFFSVSRRNWHRNACFMIARCIRTKDIESTEFSIEGGGDLVKKNDSERVSWLSVALCNKTEPFDGGSGHLTIFVRSLGKVSLDRFW